MARACAVVFGRSARKSTEPGQGGEAPQDARRVSFSPGDFLPLDRARRAGRMPGARVAQATVSTSPNSTPCVYSALMGVILTPMTLATAGKFQGAVNTIV